MDKDSRLSKGLGCPDAMVGNEEDCRRFIEASLWMARSGAPWRTLPSEFGGWNSVYKRFAGWSERGVRRRMQDSFVGDPDVDFILIDTTIARARQAAAGAPLKRGDSRPKTSEEAEAGSAQRSA